MIKKQVSRKQLIKQYETCIASNVELKIMHEQAMKDIEKVNANLTLLDEFLTYKHGEKMWDEFEKWKENESR